MSGMRDTELSDAVETAADAFEQISAVMRGMTTSFPVPAELVAIQIGYLDEPEAGEKSEGTTPHAFLTAVWDLLVARDELKRKSPMPAAH